MSQEGQESGELHCCLHPARLGAAQVWGTMCPKANVTHIRTFITQITTFIPGLTPPLHIALG